MISINNSVLSKIETDKRMLESELLFKFAEIFNVSTDYLVGREMIRETPAQPYTPAAQAFEYIPVPIYDNIKATPEGAASFESLLGYNMLPKDQVSGGQFFYLVIQDNNMIEEGIQAGNKVLIRQQDHITDGKIAVVLVGQTQAFLRKVYHQDEFAILVSANRSFPPTIVPRKSMTILGQVIQAAITFE